MIRRVPFQYLLHRGVGEGTAPFPGLLHFTLDHYLIVLSVKEGGIKYHFLSLWYDSTWDWTQVSQTTGKHSILRTQFKCKKIFLFQAIQLSQIVLIQTTNFSISRVFVYPLLDVKTVLFQTTQFSIQKQIYFNQYSLV